MSGKNKTILVISCITALGYIIVQLDVTIVNVAIPTFRRAFSVDVDTLKWIPDAYVISFASLLLIAGSLSDRYGSRRVHITGLWIFMLASIGCSLSPSIGVMIAGRIAQGVGGALILPSSLALLTGCFNGNASAQRTAIGWWSAIGGLISASGPLLGAGILSTLAWPFLFWVNVPVCLAGIVLVHLYVPGTQGNEHVKVNYQSGGWVALTSFTLIYILTLVGKLDVFNIYFYTSLVGIALLCGYAGYNIKKYRLLERYQENFSATKINAIALTAAITNYSFYGAIFSLTLYFQVVRGFSAWQTGLALLTFVVIAVANSGSGWLANRFGNKITICLGLLFSALISLVIAMLIKEEAPYPLFVLVLFGMPLGSGVAVPLLLSEFLASIPPMYASTASAIINTTRQLGGALGVAVVSMLLSGAWFSPTTGALLGFVLGGGLVVIGALLICRYTE